MRVYTDKKKTEIKQVICNCCRKNLLVENGFLREECIRIEHDFGFFGTRDGISHGFDLCEDCYQKLIEGFSVPVEEWERKELL